MPKRPCSFAGGQCPELVEIGERLCEEHRKENDRSERIRKGSAWSRGYDTAWYRVRDRALRRDQYCCVLCLRNDARYVPAVDVDHIIPFHGKDDPKRLDLNNLQSLCEPCHSRKTATEDRGFGNTPKRN